MSTHKPQKPKRKTAKEKLLEGFERWPQLLSATNSELADALMIRHTMTVSQALSALHNDGKIRVWYDGELTPVRHIDLL